MLFFYLSTDIKLLLRLIPASTIKEYTFLQYCTLSQYFVDEVFTAVSPNYSSQTTLKSAIKTSTCFNVYFV